MVLRSILFVTLALAAGTQTYSDTLSWSVGPLLETGFGTSSYFLDVNDGSYGIQSLLEFPLDSVYVGAEARLALPEQNIRLGLRLLTTLGAPRGLMYDYDWDYQVGDPPIPFSYTESNLKYRSFDLDLTGDLLLLEGGYRRLYLRGGYRFLAAHQLITDYEGWQYRIDEEYDPDWDTDTTEEYLRVGIASNQDAIDYLILFHIASVGLRAETEFPRSIRLGIEGAPLGGFFFDRDDHLLRNKLSTGRGIGYGYRLGADLEIDFDTHASERRFYLRLYGSYSWFFSPGVQEQSWYGDDNGTPAGTTYTGLVHEVTLIDPRLGVSLGFRFGP